MATHESSPQSGGDLWDNLPQFPADIPVAKVNNISHAALCNGDIAALHALLSSARTTGFFRLDLTDTENGRRFLASSDKMFDLAAKIFDLPVDVKLKDNMLNHGTALLGYTDLHVCFVCDSC